VSAKFLVLLALSSTLALPAATQASTDGGASAFSASPPPPSSDDARGVTLRVRPVALLGRVVRFGGTVPSGQERETVSIQRRDPRAGWVTLVQTRSDGTGSYSASWRARSAGRLVVRALATPARSARRTATAAEARGVPLTVFRPARATYYGPGFYGSRTACGVRLTAQTLGVAHRSLPCGTRVAILYRGRTVTVPVIDRGPYANNADWDLTSATAQRVGLSATATIGTLTAEGKRGF